MSSAHETSQASSSPVDMTRESPVTSPALSRRSDLQSIPNGHENALQHRILELKKQQQLQQQILLQQFQVQQQQLAQQHEEQLRHHLKELWEQQKEQQAREQERLESLKKKEKHEQSAVASSEVKQKLQGFILGKKQREAAAAANGTVPGQGFRSWSVLHNAGSDSQSKQVVSVTGSGSVVPPYHLNPLLKNFDDDFPLRKTASEPNLLKVRLKQRVIERRSSPIARRRDRHPKRKSQLAIEPNSNPDSGPNSPPVTVTSQMSPPAGHNMPIQEEGKSPYNPATAGSMTDLSALYQSPSMPNISLGRPPTSSSQSETRLAPVSEAEVRAAFTARFGTPLTGQMLSGTLPYYPTLPVIEAGEYSSSTSSPTHSLQSTRQHMQAMEQQRHLPTIYHGTPITDTQVAHARLHKGGPSATNLSTKPSGGTHRPLGRTQSAPLPLGHPALLGTAPSGGPGGVMGPTASKMGSSHSQMLKQQIRQTVLTRVGSRAKLHLEEETINDDNCQVIDLTDRDRSRSERDNGEESEMCRQQKERETFLQQQRDLMMRHTLQVSEGSAFSPRTSQVGRPLSRALSSPLVALVNAGGPDSSCSGSASGSSPHPQATTGLAFDSLMLKHACVCGDNSCHLEHGGRLQSVWARLGETGLVQRCERVRSRKASLEELQVCHSEAHVLLFGTNPLNRQKLDMNKLSQLPIKSFVRLACGGVGVDSDTTWNELHTAPAARMAVGCVVELAMKTAMGDMKNGMAVVRPPGHHAETSQAMGFCFFNSVAIAARLLQQRLDLRRILIVDWDVHHGNGTQQMFYEDDRVLYVSLHRHDDGNFFPGTGGPTECGAGAGLGFNVNVAWSGGLNPPMGDAEYLAAFRAIVMPIATQFAPDIVLVSAGFDAAAGHPPPLGGYKLTPACFGYMTQQLMQLADKKVVLSLEGGYDLPAICDSAEECVRALLGDEPRPISDEELRRPPNQNAVETMQKTIAIQLNRWPVLKRSAHLVACCALEAQQLTGGGGMGGAGGGGGVDSCSEESETVTATMASLSMQQQQQQQQQQQMAAASRMHSQTPEQSRETSVEPMEEDDFK
ncbi:LOW QUALITY PROTEIN: histone deacetylase 4 [Nilaparvata lugens]|uniref:LOW QUALITY PROTEIN: histone deacetylase 4 n=1 Tax=Nilaparvata lugens TaxID=108931 RepID=UPI00193D75E5|nr:LOW QUALITY PROTEIN: histone deacetylase 4 [Nilaparvata lugens]